MPIHLVMLGRMMKKYKSILCLILALSMICCFSVTAFATGDEADVEEVVDTVAQKEAEAAAEKAAAEAEAAKVNDVVDLDADEPSDSAANTVAAEETVAPAQSSSRMSGPVLSLVVGAVLLVFGLIVVMLSNKKIKSGKKGKASK